MDCKVLVLGAGGLGCEILKNLAMLHVKEIHVVDMDTIELTNLNRQFLFRDEDIGKPKAQVAADYIERWSKLRRMRKTNVSDIKVVAYVQDLTNLPLDFFKQYQFIISGLDAIEPRRFVNEIVIQITRETKFELCIPFIDGGTEGFKGHVKTIIPGVTACWECSIDTLPSQQQSYPMCTVANNPRSLEHVIEYVATVECPDANLDDPKELQRMLELSLRRSREFHIDTKDLSVGFMLGIIKHIIPSVSSTNAIVAATCCNVMVKIYYDLIDYSEMPNFTTINGADGFFFHSFQYKRKPNCLVCSCL